MEALALRRLTGAITLSPQKPEVGRPYYMARCKFDALDLLVEDGGSNLLHWWTRLRPIRTGGELDLEFAVTHEFS